MPTFEAIVPDEQRHVYDDWHIAPAVRVGDFVFCSGVMGVAADGTVPATDEDQFELLFENLAQLLAAAGASVDQVYELVSFHLDLPASVTPFSTVKDRHIGEPYPAWTAVGVAELGAGAFPGLQVELKASAHAPRH
jgi:enamine deaminase RidA (YjgF/YER057c/UK114 family)